MYKLVAIALVASSILAQTSSTTSTSNTGSTTTTSGTTSGSTTTTVTLRTAACPSDVYCLSCNSTKCALCAYSYADSNGICQLPTNSVTNCVSYSSATVCAACDYGYYLNNGACTAITVTDCEVVSASAPTVCVGCDNSKLASSTGSCTSGTSCTLSNCDICQSNTKCLKCSDNYSLTSSGTCVAEPTSDCFQVAASTTTTSGSTTGSTTTSSGTTTTGSTTTTSSVCGICDYGYYANGTSCTVSSAQASAGIFAVFVSMFAFVKLFA